VHPEVAAAIAKALAAMKLRNMAVSFSGPRSFRGFFDDLCIRALVGNLDGYSIKVDIRAVIASVFNTVVEQIDSTRRSRLALPFDGFPFPLIHPAARRDGVDVTGFHVLPPIVGTRSRPLTWTLFLSLSVAEHDRRSTQAR
jgi:hypothetical protein